MSMEQRLQQLEQQTEDEQNLVMPWPEWRRFQRLTLQERRAYWEGKLRALIGEILGREGAATESTDA